MARIPESALGQAALEKARANAKAHALLPDFQIWEIPAGVEYGRPTWTGKRHECKRRLAKLRANANGSRYYLASCDAA